jgi:phosphohistidine swiveling domain-containing protein
MKSVFSEKISDSLLKQISLCTWYRHGIYRDNLLQVSMQMKYVGEEWFALEEISQGIDNLIRLGNPAFLDEKEAKKLEEIFAQKIIQEGLLFLLTYREKHTRACAQIIKVSEQIAQNSYEESSNSQLWEIFAVFAEPIQYSIHWLWSMEFLNPAFDKYVNAVLKEWKPRWSTEQRENFIGSISFPTKKLPFQEEKEEILRMDMNDATVFTKMYKRYAWLNIYVLDGRPFTVDEYRERIHLIRNDESLAQQVRDLDNNIHEASKIISSVKNLEVQKLLYIVQELIYLKTARIDAYAIAKYNALKLFDEIARRLGIIEDQLSQLTIDEVRGALLDKQLPNDLNERKKYALVRFKKRVYYFYKEAYKKIESVLYKENYSHINEIKGIVAYKGLVRGRARVLLTDRDLGKLEKGDILVSNMTNPSYNPAFSIVAGVVTDEGGMLCHSAIMAREFKIPCIIGTKIATQVLKDGDLVEVDANNGVVRILEK